MYKIISETLETKKHGKVTHVFKVDQDGFVITHDEVYHDPQFTSLELDQIYSYYG